MPDPVTPTDVPVAQTPPPAPVPQPAPATEPKPQPPPAPPAPGPSAADGDLRPETVIQYTGKDGQTRYATIKDLVDRAESEGAQIPPEQLARYRTMEKGLIGNDPEAIRAMLEMVVPGLGTGQPKPAEPQDPVAERLARIEAMAEAGKKLADRIEEERLTAGCGALVEQWAEKVPYLAKHPQAGALVYSRVQAINANYKAAGDNPEAWPRDRQLKIIAEAMRAADNELGSIATMYGAPPPVPHKPQPQPQNVQVQNDQNQPGVEPGVIPARFKVDPATGLLVDTHGRAVGQTPWGQTIPSEIPNPAAAGGHVAGTVPVAKQPMTREQLMNVMRARAAEMNAQ